MSSIKIARSLKKQENVINGKNEKQSKETKPKMTQILNYQRAVKQHF